MMMVSLQPNLSNPIGLTSLVFHAPQLLWMAPFKAIKMAEIGDSYTINP